MMSELIECVMSPLKGLLSSFLDFFLQLHHFYWGRRVAKLRLFPEFYSSSKSHNNMTASSFLSAPKKADYGFSGSRSGSLDNSQEHDVFRFLPFWHKKSCVYKEQRSFSQIFLLPSTDNFEIKIAFVGTLF